MRRPWYLAIAVLTGTFFLTLAFVLQSPSLLAQPGEDFPKPTFNDDGELIRPDISYREWVYMGTPLTPNELNPPEAPFPEFHNVYIHPDDFDHWKRTGTFPNGTVIVKELVSVGAKQAVSGNGYFMGEFVGLEATIKDTERFADEPGYWAYFSFGHSYPLADSAAAFPAAACNACHEASAADDFVFTQFYPVLRAAKGERSANRHFDAAAGRMTAESDEYAEMASAMTTATNSAFEPTAETPTGIDSPVPTNNSDLFAYLQAGSYRDFAAQESSNHPSGGPHTKIGWPVRVFLDPTLNASLQAGNVQHPVGSSAVKEMYDDGGQLQGWAVMVKSHDDSQGGAGWFWYEITSTTDGSTPVASGNGVPLCSGCHFGGDDFVLTGYPLK